MQKNQEKQKLVDLKISDLSSLSSFSKWCIEHIDSVKERSLKKNTRQMPINEAKKILQFLLDTIKGGDTKLFAKEIKKLIERLEHYEKDEKKFIP